MPTEPVLAGTARPDPRTALWLVALAVATFLTIGSIGLLGPGAYYDELHQAPAAFAWLGQDPGMFARGKVAGIPLFNMSYSGAIKSNLFGLWLRLSGQPFSLAGWRWCGLLFGAGGILAFGLLAARSLPWRRLAVVLAFVVTDATLVVACRHDWGPVALGFLLRMVLLGLCLRPARAGERLLPLALGFGLGLAVFEKLSSLVTIAPVLLLFFAARERRRPRTVLAVLGAATFGALPVLVWNLQWLAGTGKVASLMQTGTPATHDLGELARIAVAAAELPQGDAVFHFVFGTAAAPWLPTIEAVLLAVALALVLAAPSRQGRLCAVGAGLVVLALFALPSRTEVHHHVLVTPWPYLAVALAFDEGRAGRALRWVVVAWLGLRAVTAALLIGTLASGAAQPRWTPEFHRLMSCVGQRGPHDRFVAGDWGVATQMVCAAQGHAGIVDECYRDAVLPKLGGAERVFLVGLRPESDVAPGAFARLEAQLAARRDLRADEPPPELRDLHDLQVRVFRRAD